jgi:hypothetical protein
VREPNTKDILKLKGTNPLLQRIVLRAISLSAVDFIIIQGLRKDAQQWQLVQEGKSQTLNSRHLTGDAVDVAAIINKKISWDPVFYPVIAKAFAQAATEAKQNIRWGGCWKMLPEWPTDTPVIRAMLENYKDVCIAKNKKPFCDLGHFEIPRVTSEEL